MDERGFTLIELLVAVLIIGILAAIALPTFLGQTDKARDASAKTDVRNAITEMETCYVIESTYTGCPTAASPLGAGVVATVSGDGTTYFVRKISGSGTTFQIKRLQYDYERTCTMPGTGGCGSDGSW